MTSEPCAVEGWPNIFFHYFDEKEMQQTRTKVSRLSIRTDEPEIVKVDRGIVPERQFIAAKKCVVGIFDSDHRLVTASIRTGGGGKGIGPQPDAAVLENAEFDNRNACYFGHASVHFGHFLLETLSRAWAWRVLRDDIVPVMHGPPRLPKFVKSFLALVPGFTQRLEFIKRITKFESVYVPTPAFVIRKHAYLEYKSLCDTLAERALPTRVTLTDRPVYLSRRGLGPFANRALVGEERLEAFLEEEGFLVVQPEALTIAEQIKLFNSHRWIVSLMGSACHTRVFSREQNNLLMLTRPDYTPNFALCDGLCYGIAHYANVLWAPDYRPGGPAVWEPVLLKEYEFLTLMKEFGLVRAKVEFKGPPPDLELYRKRWKQAAVHESARARTTDTQGLWN